MKSENNRIRNIFILVSLLAIFAGIVGAWASNSQKTLTLIIEQNKIRNKVETNQNNITELKTDIKYIKKGIDRIEGKMN